MRLPILGAALTAATLSCPALALPTLSLDGSYESARERDTDLMARGYNAGLAFGLGKYFSIGGNYSMLRTEQFADSASGASGRLEYKTYGGSLGFGCSLTDITDLGLSAGYVTSKTDGVDGLESRPEDKTSGPVGSLTLTHRMGEHFEMFLGPNYSYLGHKRGVDGDVGLGLEIAHGLWLQGAYWAGQTRDGCQVAPKGWPCGYGGPTTTAPETFDFQGET